VRVRERELDGVPWPLAGLMSELVREIEDGSLCRGWVREIEDKEPELRDRRRQKREDRDGGGLESMRVREIETAVRSGA
jgi:ketol-acid reductoisomerase